MPGISALLDSDMETTNFMDENSLISSVSDTTSVAQTREAKKPRKRICVGMPKKPRAKRTIEPASNPTSRATAAKRKTAEREEVEEDDLAEVEPPKPRGKRTKATKAKEGAPNAESEKTTKKKQPKKEAIEEEAMEEDAAPSPVAIRSNFAQTKTVRPTPRPIPASKSKTGVRKPSTAATKTAEEVVSDDEQEDDHIVQHQPARKRVRTESISRTEPAYRRRAGSVSDTERADPLLRRKLGDITRKFENVDMKYRHLKEVAISEANSNVDKMRRQCEAVTEASDKLVTSLKQQLATQAPLIQESRKIKKDAQAHEAEVTKLRQANHDLSSTLAAAQNEIKALHTKLSAARATSAPPDVKQRPTVGQSAVAANSESEKMSQLKIDLYADLTGLIVRSVKQSEDGDTYDCIQTGRNGTLHFKLFVDQENAKKVGFEETEFLYTPLLDASRDRTLIDIMPDYLTEDITFERAVAAKFYGRVVKTLTEPPASEQEE